MKIVRFKMSKVTKEDKVEMLAMLQDAVQWYCKKYEVSTWPLSISLDIPNACIRSGMLKDEINGIEIEIFEDSIVEITAKPSQWNRCDSNLIFIDDPFTIKTIPCGTEISIRYGQIVTIVTEVVDSLTLKCKCVQGGMLRSLDFVCVRGIKHARPPLSKADMTLINFAKEHKMDIITINSLRRAETLHLIRKLFDGHRNTPLLISTICEQEGLDNIDAIIKSTDGIILAREFLAFEILNPQKMITIQLQLSAKCKLAGKPFYLSGNILDSTLLTGKLTGCDLIDITNGVLQGAGFVMRHYKDPSNVTNAIKHMDTICKAVEPVISKTNDFWRLSDFCSVPVNAAEACIIACALLAKVSEALAIIVPTATGITAMWISQMLPESAILAITTRATVARKLHIYRGIVPIVYDQPSKLNWHEDIENRVKFAVNYGIKYDILTYGSHYVAITKSGATSAYADNVSLWTVMTEENKKNNGRKIIYKNVKNSYMEILKRVKTKPNVTQSVSDIEGNTNAGKVFHSLAVLITKVDWNRMVLIDGISTINGWHPAEPNIWLSGGRMVMGNQMVQFLSTLSQHTMERHEYIKFENLDLSNPDILYRHPYKQRRSPIMITLADPNITTVDIQKLMELGTNIIKLKISHCTKGEKIMLINKVGKATASLCKKHASLDWPVTTCIELKTSTVRTGVLAGVEQVITLKEGTFVDLTCNVHDFDKCTPTKVFIDNPYLSVDVRIGGYLNINQDEIEVKCKKILNETSIRCKVTKGGQLTNMCLVSIRGGRTKRPLITKKDLSIVTFALEYKIDIIIVNYSRHVSLIQTIKKYIKDNIRAAVGKKMRKPIILGAICSTEGLENVDDIIKESDGIIFAREFLAYEVEDDCRYKLLQMQKLVGGKCLQEGKPFYVSGEVFKRALSDGDHYTNEAADVTNALLDGATGFVLRDTPNVEILFEVVRTINELCCAVEPLTNTKGGFWRILDGMRMPINAAEACAMSCAILANQTRARVVIIPTVTGQTAKIFMWLRPASIVLTVSSKATTTRRLQSYRSIIPLMFEGPAFYSNWEKAIEARVQFAVEYAVKVGWVKLGDAYVTLQRGTDQSAFCDTVRAWNVTISKKTAVECPDDTEKPEKRRKTLI